MTESEQIKAVQPLLAQIEQLRERCPKCGSHEISKRHHQGSFALPECDFRQCDDCDHQWGHQ